ncbi:MAG TPA: sigma-70 family RNA polymerase sigma factor [Ramlibacter sp.]|jgi:RNA polymerase sigma factor for flagellar operon FliA|nr:sigma-70 family RNA polymerase sigma factor [Ramlibacter sp.]
MQAAATAGSDEADLWARLRSQGDADARERILALHLPYAKVVAATYYGRRFHDEIEFGDYHQFASLGMLEAVDRFDPARGVQFRTFAARRMHGAILNGLERLTEKQQQIAARARIRAERVQEIKAAAGGTPPASVDELMRYVSEVGIGLALCWMLEGTAMIDLPQGSTSAPFYQSVAVRQLRERLLLAVDALPPQERTVVRSHYLQDMQFDQIAAMLQLTKGRISQIHKQALQRLRNQVRDHAEWNLTL